MNCRIDVEGSNVAAVDVFRIILGMIATHATADVVVPGDALTKIQQHRSRRIGGSYPLIVANDDLWQDRRPIAAPLSKGLSVVGLVAVHPADNDRVVLLLQSERVLIADHRHPNLCQSRKLFLIRPFPKADVEVDSRFLKLRGIPGILQPNGDGKIVFALRRPMAPFG